MKYAIMTIVCLCSMQMAFSVGDENQLTLPESLAQTFQTLGISSDSSIGKTLGTVMVAAGLYTFFETAYRRFNRWKHSSDPKKADFNGFVKRLALDTLTEIGVVTYEEVSQVVRLYLEEHQSTLLEEEVRAIADDVAREVVDQYTGQLLARIDALESTQEA